MREKKIFTASGGKLYYIEKKKDNDSFCFSKDFLVSYLIDQLTKNPEEDQDPEAFLNDPKNILKIGILIKQLERYPDENRKIKSNEKDGLWGVVGDAIDNINTVKELILKLKELIKDKIEKIMSLEIKNANNDNIGNLIEFITDLQKLQVLEESKLNSYIQKANQKKVVLDNEKKELEKAEKKKQEAVVVAPEPVKKNQ